MTHELRRLYQNDPTVHRILRSGGTLEECVLALAQQKNELTAQVQRLKLIAPVKIVDNDGRAWIQHCPDHLAPANSTPLNTSWTKSPLSAPT